MARRTVGVILTLLGVALLASVVGMGMLYWVTTRGPSVPSHAVLTLSIGGDLPEVAPADVFGYLRGASVPTLRSVVDNLRKAAADRRVAAVLIKPAGFSSPYWGKVQEIRDALVAFRKSGKPLYAYLEYGGDREYFLATAANKVFLSPSSPLDVTGVATYAVFLRGTLDKIGAYPDLQHIGDYKTASNQFTEKAYTAAHREMDASLGRDLFEQIVGVIAEGRGKTEADVRRLVDEGPFLPDAALSAGLIDEVAYEDEVLDALHEAVPDANGHEIDGDDYTQVSLTSLGLNRGPRIAVIHASGAIASGEGGFDPLSGMAIGSDTLVEYIREAREDRSIRAIVLRIDSPGGSAAASDAVWRELIVTRDERADRPLVASMSDLAASGGYYLAMPAKTIVAQPATLTGSIGIYGGKFVTGGVYEKLGARIESTSIGKHAEMNSPARPYNADEGAKLREQLQDFYDQFVQKVAESRGASREKIDRISQGRVWTGRQAKEHGLVDALGGLDHAVMLAKEQAGIPADSDVTLVMYPPRRSLYEILTTEFSGEARSASFARWLAANVSSAELDVLRAVRGPSAFFRRGEPLALMPFSFIR